MPAQDVYVIETEKGEVLIPAVEAFIKGIHSSRREIEIKPIDGLLDLNAD
jgi:ribosomal 30S subunit maturation factor RimM